MTLAQLIRRHGRAIGRKIWAYRIAPPSQRRRRHRELVMRVAELIKRRGR